MNYWNFSIFTSVIFLLISLLGPSSYMFIPIHGTLIVFSCFQISIGLALLFFFNGILYRFKFRRKVERIYLRFSIHYYFSRLLSACLLVVLYWADVMMEKVSSQYSNGLSYFEIDSNFGAFTFILVFLLTGIELLYLINLFLLKPSLLK